MNNSGRIRLRNKKITDARDDYNWQSDPELASLDATIPPKIPFTLYLAEYTWELSFFNSSRREFAIETLAGKHIGNCVYYGIDWRKRETELGIMIGKRDFWNQGYGTEAVTAVINHIFRETELNRIYLKTLTWNVRAQKCFEKSGFITYGNLEKNGQSFKLMEIRRAHWENGNRPPPSST